MNRDITPEERREAERRMGELEQWIDKALADIRDGGQLTEFYNLLADLPKRWDTVKSRELRKLIAMMAYHSAGARLTERLAKQDAADKKPSSEITGQISKSIQRRRAIQEGDSND